MATKGSAASVEVIRSMRNVNIKDESNVPDAKTFAAKYDMDTGLDGAGDDNDGMGGSGDMEGLRDIMHNQDLVQRTDGLVRKLDEKNREVERLCTLLESVSIIPGVNPDRLLDIYDNVAEEPIDLRDSKIVHLAKKVRNMTVVLNKEKALKIASDNRAEEYKREVDMLQRELHLLSSPAARAAARAEAKGEAKGDLSSALPRDNRKELLAANKQVPNFNIFFTFSFC